MQINYSETVSDLAKRIEIHQKYGTRDIDKWMLDLLDLKPGTAILDIGCGSGKQCFIFHDFFKGVCRIVGGDVSDELLQRAKDENSKKATGITFIKLDFDQKLPFPDKSFDLVTCSFAIYYAKNISLSVAEIFRVLKPKGRLFTTGPMPENKQTFYEIIKLATGKPIPRMPGSSRYSSEILSAINNQSAHTAVHIFENALVFRQAEPFIDYVRASLSEDRRLWADLFRDESFDQIIDKISKVATRMIQKHGQIVMTKVVGGFVASK